MTDPGGWCIHGVPYGPNWSCALCSTSSNRASFSTEIKPPPELLEALEWAFEQLDDWDEPWISGKAVISDPVAWAAYLAEKARHRDALAAARSEAPGELDAALLDADPLWVGDQADIRQASTGGPDFTVKDWDEAGAPREDERLPVCAACGGSGLASAINVESRAGG